MPEYNLHIVIDSDKTYSQEQLAELKSSIIEKIDLMTGAGAAAIHFVLMGAGETGYELRQAWTTISRVITGRFPYLEKAIGLLDLQAVRDFTRLVRGIEDALTTAEQRGAHKFARKF